MGNTGTQSDFIASLKGVKGVKGDTGDAGANGTDGKSAYQIWLDLGNTGTQSDFIASLKGVKGDTGYTGATGANGTSAYSNAVAGGYTGTETQFNSDLSKTSNAIHTNVANEYSTIPEKTTFDDNDIFIREDSADGGKKKSFKWSSLKTALNSLYKPSTYYGEFKDEFLNIADGNVTVELKKSMVLGLSGVAGADLTSANNITFTLPTPIAGEFNQSVIYFKIGATIPTINHPANTLILGTFVPNSFSTVILTYDQIRTAASTWQRVLSVKKV